MLNTSLALRFLAIDAFATPKISQTPNLSISHSIHHHIIKSLPFFCGADTACPGFCSSACTFKISGFHSAINIMPLRGKHHHIVSSSHQIITSQHQITSSHHFIFHPPHSFSTSLLKRTCGVCGLVIRVVLLTT